MIALLACLSVVLSPQAVPIELKEGLALRGVTRSSRNPVFTDRLLLSLIDSDWKAPKPGDEVAVGEEKRTWVPLKAGEDGSFAGNAFQGGYAFFEVEKAAPEIMVLESSGWGMVYVDGAPRAGDPYGFGYLKMPVKLNAGKTGFLFQSGRGRPRAKLVPPIASAFLNLGDATVPDILAGKAGQYWAGLIVVNATEKWSGDIKLRARVGEGPQTDTIVPPIAPLSFRKIPVPLEAPTLLEPGEAPLTLTLYNAFGMLDFQKLNLRVRGPKQSRKVTFFSEQDGSIQYYGLQPAQTEGDGKALVLTLHGASVEAIGQADAYAGKDWCHIVAPSNRRPYGFDWEEIGRRDALEVLNHARATLKTDPLQTYLTGHSMGGHGAWTVGFHYPDHWAAVAPCAAWISFFSYGGGPRPEPKTPVDEVIYRAANASDTLMMLANSLNFPLYIHHGDRDETVNVREAREMKAHLERINHPNATLHEHPGGGHWFGESVDFPPIFDLFKTVKRIPSTEKQAIDFSSANLAATSRAWWVQILQQEKPLAVSRVRIRRAAGRVIGTTENMAALRLDSEAFAKGVNPRVIEIDDQTISLPNIVDPAPPVTLAKINGRWTGVSPWLEGQKRPEQMGPFKEVFKNRFFFVYGTDGNDEEDRMLLAKVRYDSEVFGYRGNGSVRIVSDREFLRELEEEKGRVYIRKPDIPNVILYGNEQTNSAWSSMLKECPISVRRGEIKVDRQVFRGEGLGCLFVRPRPDDDVALVGVVAATGRAGQRILDRIPYFVSGVHLPDWTVFDTSMLSEGSTGVKAAGFFSNGWRL